MKYSLHIASASAITEAQVNTVVDVRTGSLKLIELAAKESRAELAGRNNDAADYRVRLAEQDSEGNGDTVLLDLSSDGETVSEVLAARLKRLKKSNSSDAPAPKPLDTV